VSGATDLSCNFIEVFPLPAEEPTCFIDSINFWIGPNNSPTPAGIVAILAILAIKIKLLASNHKTFCLRGLRTPRYFRWNFMVVARPVQLGGRNT
jgi:hypothetical protein